MPLTPVISAAAGLTMFTDVAKAANATLAIYQKRRIIQDFLRRSAVQLTRGTSHVGVFGAGGVGKTTFGRWASQTLDTDQAVPDYLETFAVEKVSPGGSMPVRLHIGPGQQRRREAKWPELFRDLAKGKTARVINIVSAGLHSTQLERSRLTSDPSMSDDMVRKEYVERARSDEILALGDLVPHLKATAEPVKMITLVTKQDLWWKNRNEVASHYENGAYAALIEDISKSKGTTNFQHTLISCALVEQNLLAADRFVIAETSAGYDDPLRLTNLERVAAAYAELVSHG